MTIAEQLVQLRGQQVSVDGFPLKVLEFDAAEGIYHIDVPDFPTFRVEDVLEIVAGNRIHLQDGFLTNYYWDQIAEDEHLNPHDLPPDPNDWRF